MNIIKRNVHHFVTKSATARATFSTRIARRVRQTTPTTRFYNSKHPNDGVFGKKLYVFFLSTFKMRTKLRQRRKYNRARRFQSSSSPYITFFLFFFETTRFPLIHANSSEPYDGFTTNEKS